MTTKPPAAYIDETGIHIPTLIEIRDYMVAKMQAIYGADIYLGNDSQDGQLISLFAQMVHDANSLSVSVYNSFDPQESVGVPLSRVVKINGIERDVPTRSTVDLRCIGRAGVTVTGGQCGADNGSIWALEDFTFPPEGDVIVSAICAELGAVPAPADTINQIVTPTAGWDSVTNPAAATVGAPVERDAQLRIRQRNSTMMPSHTVAEGLLGSLGDVPGVSAVWLFENDQGLVGDRYSVPPHSLAAVVSGGDADAVAAVIANCKGLGVQTAGTSMVAVLDSAGAEKQIKFSRPTRPPITYEVSLTPKVGYSTDVRNRIKSTLADWTNELGAGALIELDDLTAVIKGIVGASTFRLNSVRLRRDAAALDDADLSFDYFEQPSCVVGDVSILLPV